MYIYYGFVLLNTIAAIALACEDETEIAFKKTFTENRQKESEL